MSIVLISGQAPKYQLDSLDSRQSDAIRIVDDPSLTWWLVLDGLDSLEQQGTRAKLLGSYYSLVKYKEVIII